MPRNKGNVQYWMRADEEPTGDADLLMMCRYTCPAATSPALQPDKHIRVSRAKRRAQRRTRDAARAAAALTPELDAEAQRREDVLAEVHAFSLGDPTPAYEAWAEGGRAEDDDDDDDDDHSHDHGHWWRRRWGGKRWGGKRGRGKGRHRRDADVNGRGRGRGSRRRSYGDDSWSRSDSHSTSDEHSESGSRSDSREHSRRHSRSRHGHWHWHSHSHSHDEEEEEEFRTDKWRFDVLDTEFRVAIVKEVSAEHLAELRTQSDLILSIEEDSFMAEARAQPRNVLKCDDAQTGHDTPWGIRQTTSDADTGLNDHFRHGRFWGTGVHVFLFDKPVNCDHPDFAPTRARGACGHFHARVKKDQNDHGTRMASIIIGERSGIAKQSNLVSMNRQTTQSWRDERLTTSELIEGLQEVHSLFIRANQLRKEVAIIVIGAITYDTPAARQALLQVTAGGVHVVVPAGNDGQDAAASGGIAAVGLTSPVIVVAASTKTGTAASFSNHGPAVTLWAPGEDVETASDDRYFETSSGTSFAAAHVAGVVAAYLTYDKTKLMPPGVMKEMLSHHALQDVLVIEPPKSPLSNRLVHITCEKPAICGSVRDSFHNIISRPRGAIAYPDPRRIYPNNARVCWKLTCPGPTTVIFDDRVGVLPGDSLKLYKLHPGGDVSFIEEVTNTQKGEATLGRQAEAEAVFLPPITRTVQGDALVVFVSDSVGGSYGFTFSYRCPAATEAPSGPAPTPPPTPPPAYVVPPMCDDIKTLSWPDDFPEFTAHVAFPDYGLTYFHHTSRCWRVICPHSHRVNVAEIDVKTGGSLALFDIDKVGAQLTELARWSGDEPPTDKTYFTDLLLHFAADETYKFHSRFIVRFMCFPAVDPM
eukprot:Rhum_TRINITY_DN15307_c11_g2::Rhum_TRINITY_DN15307_c11_g2_i1::g.151966::m.151966